MRQLGIFLSLVLLVSLAACRGGPPVRIFPPELRVQELRAGDGDWVLVLRVNNFSTVPMRIKDLDVAWHPDTFPGLPLRSRPDVLVSANSVELLEVTVRPDAALRERVASVLAERRALSYTLSGKIQFSEPRAQTFEVDYRNGALNPAPGLAGVLR